MMHLNFSIGQNGEQYFLSSVGIDGGVNENKLYELCQSGVLNILNPSAWFSQKMRRKFYEHTPDGVITMEAECSKILSELFDCPEDLSKEHSANVFLLFSKLAAKYIELKNENNYLRTQQGWEECTDSPWDNEE